MHFEEYPELKEELLGKLRKQLEGKRTGIHMSDLTHCITKSYWRMASKDEEKLGDTEVLYFSVGNIFEAMVTGEVSHQEGTARIYDGVSFTPDYQADLGIWIDLKTTRMSYKDELGSPTKGWPKEWGRRALGYAKALGVDGFGLGTFFLFQNRIVGTRMVFDEGEVDKFWEDFIAPRRDALVEAVAKAEPPAPYSYNDDWECLKCEFQFNCQAMSMTGMFSPRTQEADKKYLERKEKGENQ